MFEKNSHVDTDTGSDSSGKNVFLFFSLPNSKISEAWSEGGVKFRMKKKKTKTAAYKPSPIYL